MVATSTRTTPISTAWSASSGVVAAEGGVRVFTIAYGADADLASLERISEASRAAAYDATDPLTIDSVFTNVLSNF